MIFTEGGICYRVMHPPRAYVEKNAVFMQEIQ